MAEPYRVDLRDKLTGAARFIDDIPDPSRVAHAAAIRSPYSHARIVSIDASRAEQLPGVLAVLHRETVSEYGIHLEYPSVENHLITIDKARFDGDLIGMVVAEDRRTALRAAELVDVEYELLPVLFSPEEAFAPNAPLVHEHVPGNLAYQASLEWGDVEGALAAADRVVESSFTSPAIYHHPIEPAMGALVVPSSDGIEVWVPTNNPFDVVNVAASLFGLEKEQIRVHVPYVGGNFGAKHLAPEVLAAAALARKIGRPVRYMATEGESFRVTSRHAMTYRARVGLQADGTVVALDVVLLVDTGAYFTGAAIATSNAVNSAWGGYRVPNMRVRARTAYTNKVPAAMFRNTGKNQTTFGLDCAMDNVAHVLGVDPVQFRLRNLLGRGERQNVEIWKRDGKASVAQIPPLDTDFRAMIDRALDAIDWDGKPRTDLDRAQSGRFMVGRGLAVSLRRGSSIGGATARARLLSDGRVAIEHNAPDVGEGSHTVISLVAAGSLGIPQECVVVGEPDTGNQLYFSGTSSQRTTVQMGTAVRNACEGLKREIARAAAQMKGGSPGEWVVSNGRASRGPECLTFAELARSLKPGDVVQAVGSYDRGPVPNSSFGSHDHWSPGVAAAEVEVDRETGEIRVLQYAAVADAGKVLHYHSAKGQIEGGAVMGFGAALTEEVRYEEGQLLNGDAFQYRLPLMIDIPERLHIAMLENGDGPGPFGSKGIAQTSIPCVAPALCNAIFDATGVRLTRIPFTPEAILRGLGALPKREST